jgi:hypothetical protein
LILILNSSTSLLFETNTSWSICWICTGPWPPNGSLLLYPHRDVWTTSLFDLSFPDPISQQDYRWLTTTPSNTHVFLHKKKKKTQNYNSDIRKSGNLHQLTTGTTPHGGTSEHHL